VGRHIDEKMVSTAGTSSDFNASSSVQSETGGCPIKGEEERRNCTFEIKDESSDSDTTYNGSLSGWLGLGKSSKKTSDAKIGVSIPSSIEESLQHNQSPMSDQKIPLSTHRVISTIPKSDKVVCPTHQVAIDEEKSNDNWVYPSEQQFYNAMRRKGWEAPDETNMPSVVHIHNAVNEQSWKHVKRWEKETHDCDKPKLVRFMGRPKDVSPKAWIFSNLFFYKPPFDRHDWYVESKKEEIDDGVDDYEKITTRYVIDFYEGKSSSSLNTINPNMSPVSMYLDVRPALDHPRNFFDRVKIAIKDSLPGIFPPK